MPCSLIRYPAPVLSSSSDLLGCPWMFPLGKFGAPLRLLSSCYFGHVQKTFPFSFTRRRSTASTWHAGIHCLMATLEGTYILPGQHNYLGSTGMGWELYQFWPCNYLFIMCKKLGKKIIALLFPWEVEGGPEMHGWVSCNPSSNIFVQTCMY